MPGSNKRWSRTRRSRSKNLVDRCCPAEGKGLDDELLQMINLSGWRGHDEDLRLLRALCSAERGARHDIQCDYAAHCHRCKPFLPRTTYEPFGPESRGYGGDECRHGTPPRTTQADEPGFDGYSGDGRTGLEPLRELKGLTGLELSHTAVGDEGVGRLGMLPYLWRVSVICTRVTPAGIVHLRGSAPNLGRVVVFDGGAVQGPYLNLNGIFADDDLLRGLTSGPQYERIGLSQTPHQ